MSASPDIKLQPTNSTALAKIVEKNRFVNLPLPAQKNAAGLALIEACQTTGQAGFEIVSALKDSFGKSFPREAHPTKAGVRCDLFLRGTVIEIPSVANWKPQEMLSEVSVTLNTPAPRSVLTVVWRPNSKIGPAEARMQDIQVGLMSLLLRRSGEKEKSTEAKYVRRVIKTVETLLSEWKSLSPSGKDKETLENVGNVLAFVRTSGLEPKEGVTLAKTEDLAKRIEFCEKTIALLLEDKTQVPLSSPKPVEKPAKGSPHTPPPQQPSRGKLYPFLAVVGCLVAAGLGYKAYKGGLTLPKWLSWGNVGQTKRVAGAR